LTFCQKQRKRRGTVSSDVSVAEDIPAAYASIDLQLNGSVTCKQNGSSERGASTGAGTGQTGLDRTEEASGLICCCKAAFGVSTDKLRDTVSVSLLTSFT